MTFPTDLVLLFEVDGDEVTFRNRHDLLYTITAPISEVHKLLEDIRLGNSPSGPFKIEFVSGGLYAIIYTSGTIALTKPQYRELQQALRDNQDLR